ncbi:small polypeptide DEVIL 14-like [Telopea speciosissima]|nr:small polypeptide DEVIL 14-like [Telopea speciosissima]
MSQHSLSQSNPRLRSWQRCSRHIRKRRARLYIIWKCTLMLLRWRDYY